MKTLIYSFLLVFFLMNVALAQGTITSEVVFEVGEKALVQMGTGFFQPGASGENVSWDFSSLGYDTTWNWQAMDPSAMPGRDSFPGANLAFRFPANDTSQSLNFYRKSADSLEFLGSTLLMGDDTSNVLLYQMLNKKSEVIARFPFTYGSSFERTHQGRNWISYQGTRLLQTRTGTVKRSVDAYGTVKTPFGEFQDVLRVKTVQVEYDTTYFGAFTSTQQIHYTRYTWYAQGEKYLLLHMDSSAVVASGLPVSVSYNHMYRMSEVTGSTAIEAQDQVGAAFRVYPNPAQGHINLDFEVEDAGKASLYIVDLMGKVLVHRELGFLKAGVHQEQLGLEGLSQGHYILRLKGEQYLYNQPFVKN